MKAYQSSDGIRFESDSYVPAEGETLLPAPPAWDAATQKIEWNDSAWVITALDAAALTAKTNEAAAMARLPSLIQQRAAMEELAASLIDAAQVGPDARGPFVRLYAAITKRVMASTVVGAVNGGSATFNVGAALINQDERIVLTHAASIASYTIVFPAPANTRPDQKFALGSRSAVSTLTLTTTGWTMLGSNLSALTAGQNVQWHRIGPATLWRAQ